jgi:hypothetical protein
LVTLFLNDTIALDPKLPCYRKKKLTVCARVVVFVFCVFGVVQQNFFLRMRAKKVVTLVTDSLSQTQFMFKVFGSLNFSHAILTAIVLPNRIFIW